MSEREAIILTPVLLDRHLAALSVCMLAADTPADLRSAVESAAIALSALHRSGHEGLAFAEWSSLRLLQPGAQVPLPPLDAPLQAELSAALRQHPLLAVDEAAGVLLLRRQLQTRQTVERQILARCPDLQAAAAIAPATLALWQRLFPDRIASSPAGAAPNLQKLAAFTALGSRFTLITGGPGTGKTTTLGRILALLLHRDPTLKIRIAAPTGKAVNRLHQSLAQVRADIQSSCPELSPQLEGFPAQAQTLHRLLGYHAASRQFRRHAQSPLDCDLLVIDEVSMLDNELFHAVLAALPEPSAMILMGDQEQLAAVENGSVLADLCAAAAPLNICHHDVLAQLRAAAAHSLADTLAVALPPPVFHTAAAARRLAAAVVRLDYSYRSENAPRLAAAAASIKAGLPPELQHIAPAEWLELHRADFLPPVACLEELRPDMLAALLTSSRMLAAVNEGPLGVQALNALAIQTLFHCHPRDIFPGKQIVITANDYQLGLFNGDMGLILPDRAGLPHACFPDAQAGIRSIPLALLGAHDSAFALTVHKAQGSEFAQVLLVLPERDCPVLGRALIYTGVTRASVAAAVHDPATLLPLALTRCTKARPAFFLSLLQGGMAP